MTQYELTLLELQGLDEPIRAGGIPEFTPFYTLTHDWNIIRALLQETIGHNCSFFETIPV